jgi:hypothetical protein
MCPNELVVTMADVEAFSGSCVSLRSMWVHHQILFEGKRLKRELLALVATKFFSDIFDLFREHLILHICRLTDPDETMGRNNLTVKFLIAHSDFLGPTLEKLQHLSDSIHDFRKIIVPARNRFISHHDLEDIRRGILLGGASPEQWKQFWIDLQEFVHIVHQRYVDASGVFYLNDIAGLSDADSLLKALRESQFFWAAMNDREVGKRVTDIAFKSKFYDAA